MQPVTQNTVTNESNTQTVHVLCVNNIFFSALIFCSLIREICDPEQHSLLLDYIARYLYIVLAVNH